MSGRVLVGLLVAVVGWENAANAAPVGGEPSAKNGTCKYLQYGAVGIISGGDARPWTPMIRYNHEEFAKRNGYSYQFHNGNAAFPRKAFWSKVKLLIDELRNPSSSSEWLLWCDDDIVFTTLHGDMVNRWQARMVAANKAVSVSEDPAAFTVLNTGMILVRRTDDALRLLRGLWQFGSGFLSTCPQDRCLHEQQALRNLYNYGTAGDPDFYKKTLLIVPQRVAADDFNVNTFHRFSHYDSCRETFQDYSADQKHSLWSPGDFVCHVSGMHPHLRATLLTECMISAHGLGQFPQVPLLESDYPCANSASVNRK